MALIAAMSALAAAIPAHAQFFKDTSASALGCPDSGGGILPHCQNGASVASIQAASSFSQTSFKGAVAPVIVRKDKADATPANDPPPESLASEPQSEFQQFVAASVGKALPVFGAELFHRAPATFAPVDRIPVTGDYVVGPGDELIIRMWGPVNLNLELTVDRNGAVFVPQAGSIMVAGIAYHQLQGFLRSQLERVYRNFDLNVNLGQLRSIQVFAAGQARRPGSYTVSSLSSLLNALFVSGGPSSLGSMRRVQLKRNGVAVTEFDIYDLLLEGDKSKDARLLPGDVVHIPVSGPQAAIAGSVRRPGIYELKGDQTIDDLIRMAGGFTPVADTSAAKIERVRANARDIAGLTLDKTGLGTRVSNGDIVKIASVNPKFENEVTLRGNVANSGRFPYRDGIRLRDIIPDKESLVTRFYWERRNQIGFTPSGGDGGGGGEVRLSSLAPDINWSYGAIERRNGRDLSRRLIPFNPGKLVLEGDISQNLELERGDIVTIFSQRDIRVPAIQQTRFVSLEGEVQSAGIYEVKPGETLGQLIRRTGGFTPVAYLRGAEFSRESVRRDQQERLDQFVRELERDASGAAVRERGIAAYDELANANLKAENIRRSIERLRAAKVTGRIALDLGGADVGEPETLDIQLQDGDRFTVPERPSTVNILGAVFNSGSMVHETSLRVRDYLNMAGGLTRVADKARAFVIRADGTVLSRQAFGRTGQSFEMRRVGPGDSIVVPEAMARSSVMRGFRDWTQVFSQMAFGSAALSILR